MEQVLEYVVVKDIITLAIVSPVLTISTQSVVEGLRYWCLRKNSRRTSFQLTQLDTATNKDSFLVNERGWITAAADIEDGTHRSAPFFCVSDVKNLK